MSEEDRKATEGASAKRRVGLHLFHNFDYAVFEPLYALLKDRFDCMLTRNLDKLLSFRPDLLVVTHNRYYFYRPQLPTAIIVWVRHGFSSKNILKWAVNGSDFSCVSSEWIRSDYEKSGFSPRLGFWVTGFIPMDAVLKGRTSPILPEEFSNGEGTLLYAPTWNRYLNSIEMLGACWIEEVRSNFPDLNIILKPHPSTVKLFPEIMKTWSHIARADSRVYLVEDPKLSVYDYFNVSDLLLSDASSVVFYYLATDKPIVLLNNPRRFLDPEYFDAKGHEWRWRDMAIQIEDRRELVSAIERALLCPEEHADKRALYRKRIFGDNPEGKAAERTVQLIEKLMNPAVKDRKWASYCWERVEFLNRSETGGNFAARIQRHLQPLKFSLERYPRVKNALLSLSKPLIGFK